MIMVSNEVLTRTYFIKLIGLGKHVSKFYFYKNMSDLQQVIRARDGQSCDVKSHKVPKWVKQANIDIKIWEKLMKRRIYWLLKLLRFHVGI